MADVYMHSRLTEDLVAKRTANVALPVAFMGAQFSDPMYYATFHKESKRYRTIADRMHDTNTQGILIRMVEYVKSHPSQDNYSFLFGFLAHYALDVNIHPYVYHHVGVYRKNKPETHAWRGLHLKFERSIDAVLFEREQQKPARKLAITKRYFPLKTVPKDVLSLMKDTIDSSFDVDDGDVVYQTSITYMYRVLRYIATDRFGWKKLLYRLADLFVKDQDLLLADMSFFHHIEAYDFLNLEHRTWHHPVTNEPSTKSVLELYQDALVFADQLLEQVDKYLAGSKIDLSKVFTNLSLNSGIECSQSFPFQHFHIYRPKNNR